MSDVTVARTENAPCKAEGTMAAVAEAGAA